MINNELKRKSLMVFCLFILTMNLLAFTSVIINLVNPAPYLFWNLAGYTVLISLIGNIVLAYKEYRYRYTGYSYLVLHIISMLLIPLLNTLASGDVQNKTSQSIFVLILYSVIFIFGAVNAGLQIKQILKHSKENCEDAAKAGLFKNIVRWIIITLLGFCLVFGIYLMYILLGRTRGNMIEVFIPVYAVFWGLFILGISFMIIKLRWRKKKSIFNIIVLSIGIIIFITCMFPLLSVPVIIKNADTSYRQVFGDVYLDDKNIIGRYGFKPVPFSLLNYFFGTPTSDYTVIEDVLYYEGTSGVDTGIKLHFDVYMPLAERFPGNNPVLIRIHGGAWVTGGKGAMNYSATNKHFLNLGYVVFDIQYGLNNRNTSYPSTGIHQYVKGDFDIDDMIRHIGIFTTYLADHADVYKANLDSVFFTGASAGGQLSTAAALGIISGKYTDLLDSRLNVKGIIPFYPANGLPPNMGIGGTPDLVDPVMLINDSSPPCLIFHGTHDGIVPPAIANTLQDTYKKMSLSPSALIWMNFASHGSDIYTSGYYNQIFLYYMERFMHQYR
ncbi:MAG: alpha/beta hydrolase [Treponema sp.]|nr:alpha/beta hydrolase [Treponema sp.]